MAVFARKASGLVRQASLFDAFLLGFMNGGIGGGLWTMHSWGLYTFPGGNMVLASIITMLLTVCGISLAWGILGGSMPRSGGDYVYNSRIVHPALGTVTSWVEGVFTQLAWMWLLAPLIASPGVGILAGALGVPPETAAFFNTSAGMFIVATIVMVIAFIVVLLGFKAYLWAQKICFALGITGVVIGLLLITFTPTEVFMAKWDALAAQYGSASYHDMISLAEEAGYAPSTWNWVSTLGLVPSVTWSVSYGFYIGYIGGEIKRPERNILIAQLLSALVPSIICAWAGYVFQNNLGYRFMGAVAYADNEAPDWYTMPFPANWANFAAILTDNPILKFLIGFQFIVFNWLYLPISFLVFTRVLFAQALDNIGPRWFLDLSPRFGSPVKLYTLFFILSEIFISHYCFFPEWLGGISIEVLDALTVWGIIGIVCMLFPFVKKVRYIWDASPHRWPLAAVLSGIFSLILSGIMVWAFYTSPALGGINIPWSMVFIAVAIAAILWYYGWRWKRAREGIDVTLAFKELPPE
jgi:amino acid transporter